MKLNIIPSILQAALMSLLQFRRPQLIIRLHRNTKHSVPCRPCVFMLYERDTSERERGKLRWPLQVREGVMTMREPYTLSCVLISRRWRCVLDLVQIVSTWDCHTITLTCWRTIKIMASSTNSLFIHCTRHTDMLHSCLGNKKPRDNPKTFWREKTSIWYILCAQMEECYEETWYSSKSSLESALMKGRNWAVLDGNKQCTSTKSIHGCCYIVEGEIEQRVAGGRPLILPS